MNVNPVITDNETVLMGALISSPDVVLLFAFIREIMMEHRGFLIQSKFLDGFEYLLCFHI